MNVHRNRLETSSEQVGIRAEMADVSASVAKATQLLDAADSKGALRLLDETRELAKKANDAESLRQFVIAAETLRRRFRGGDARACQRLIFEAGEDYRVARGTPTPAPLVDSDASVPAASATTDRRTPWPPHGGWRRHDAQSQPPRNDEVRAIEPTSPPQAATTDLTATPFVASGRNGQLTVTPTRIMISRKGVLGFGTHGYAGDKEVDIDQITSIQFKKPGLGTVGYIQFAFQGGREAKHGIGQAVSDENSILFAPKVEADFVKAKELIDLYRATRKATPGQSGALLTPVEQLEKLAQLVEKGLVTEAEFMTKKKELLNL